MSRPVYVGDGEHVAPPDLAAYPRGFLALVDGAGRLHSASWPDDDLSDLSDAFGGIVTLERLDDGDDERHVSDETARALASHRIEPTRADVVERFVELGWGYRLTLVWRADGPVHVAVVLRPLAGGTAAIARGEDACDTEALAIALVDALDLKRRGLA